MVIDRLTQVKLLPFVMAALCIAASHSTTYACSCGPGDPPAAFNSARAVFIGRVLDGSQQVKFEDPDGDSGILEAGQVRFAVESTFKGVALSEITLAVDSNEGTSCGPYGLVRGDRYIVYAYATEKDPAVLLTGACTRTTRVDSPGAAEDLKFLGNLPPAGSGATIRGSVWADLRDEKATPLPDVTITIRGSGDTRIATKTDIDGAFTVTGLRPGKYRVEPEFPPHYTSRQKFEEVTVEDLGAVDVAFEATLDGLIRGRFVDVDGRGFDSAFLKVESSGLSSYGHSTEGDGRFEAEGLPPGEFVISVEMQHREYRLNKPYYYPGTFSRLEAKAVKLGPGETVENLVFRLPAAYRVRTIEGRVLDADGAPVVGAEVFLLCPRSSEPGGYSIEFRPPGTRTDDQGRFSIGALSGETYWIEARGLRQPTDQPGGKDLCSPARKLVVTEDVKDLTLVLGPVRGVVDCTE